jgi:hypothetical protein
MRRAIHAVGQTTWQSSDPDTLRIDGSMATILKSGIVTITATYSLKGQSSTQSAKIIIKPAKLSVKADDATVSTCGAPMPEFSYHVKGLVGSDTFTDPQISTTATDTNTPGTYDIVISGGTLSNPSYHVTYHSGSLVIGKAKEAEDAPVTTDPKHKTPSLLSILSPKTADEGTLAGLPYWQLLLFLVIILGMAAFLAFLLRRQNKEDS